MKTLYLFILFFLAYCVNPTKAQQTSEQIFEHTPELHGDSVVLSITMVNAYPFVSGEVNGIKGKFMFDTGSQPAISINDNLVKLPNKKISRTGVMGSGQSFQVSMNDTIAELKLSNGITFRKLLNIKSGNYGFLEKRVTPDCIGYIGFDFFKGYLFKLDYLRRKITFYKNTVERQSSKDFLTGEKVLGIINFETRKLPNHPFVKVNIGGIEAIGAFDTGQYGLLQLEDKAKKILIANSSVIPSGIDGYENELLTVKHIIIDRTFRTEIKGVESTTFEETLPERKGTGVTEQNLINFGYRFLDQYKTVWDYQAKKIYILQK